MQLQWRRLCKMPIKNFVEIGKKRDRHCKRGREPGSQMHVCIRRYARCKAFSKTKARLGSNCSHGQRHRTCKMVAVLGILQERSDNQHLKFEIRSRSKSARPACMQ